MIHSLLHLLVRAPHEGRGVEEAVTLLVCVSFLIVPRRTIGHSRARWFPPWLGHRANRHRVPPSPGEAVFNVQCAVFTGKV
ncbi:hypothetical protein E2C01_015251 [Portunus trituberculatus]|uniref:Uncharacterized protein n=1 Tax=Portunus trituberculatus TaxID=210409 RepID=A0A5B7DKU6_PORTR|nr:hypothetical protein [Portunus trituberculatus]